jgi:hypothetical protein
MKIFIILHTVAYVFTYEYYTVGQDLNRKIIFITLYTPFGK